GISTRSDQRLFKCNRASQARHSRQSAPVAAALRLYEPRARVSERRGYTCKLTRSAALRRENAMLARLLVVALRFFPLAARACDLCGCYTPQLESMAKEKNSMSGFYTAIAEQFTYFGSLQFDDREVANPTGQRLDSSITQFVSVTELTIASLCKLTRRLFTGISAGRKPLPSTKGPSMGSATSLFWP